MAKIANPNESGSIATAIPEPNIRPRFFRSYPYTSSFSHALPGSGSYMSVSRGYNQKSTANAFNQKYPGNQNPRQFGPISQRIKNYGPYQIQYLQGKSKVIMIKLWICNYVRGSVY